MVRFHLLLLLLVNIFLTLQLITDQGSSTEPTGLRQIAAPASINGVPRMRTTRRKYVSSGEASVGESRLFHRLRRALPARLRLGKNRVACGQLNAIEQLISGQQPLRLVQCAFERVDDEFRTCADELPIERFARADLRPNQLTLTERLCVSHAVARPQRSEHGGLALTSRDPSLSSAFERLKQAIDRRRVGWT